MFADIFFSTFKPVIEPFFFFFFTAADIFTCHSRECTHATNNINDVISSF